MMIKWVLVGVAISVTTAGIMLALNHWIEVQSKLWFEHLKEAQTPLAPPMPSEELYTGELFDCPECNLAAEVATHVTMWDPDTGHAASYVVINCPSDHDLITVTEDWFVDHVLSKNSD